MPAWPDRLLPAAASAHSGMVMARSVNGLAGIRSPVLLPMFAGAQPLAAPNVIGDGGAAASTASAAWPGGRQDGIGGKRHPLGARPRDRPRDPPPRARTRSPLVPGGWRKDLAMRT